MERVESVRLDRQRGFLFAFFCSMVRDRKEKTGRRAVGVLVVESDRFFVVADLFSAATRFGFHFRLCVHLDSLYPKSDYPLSAQGSALGLPGLRNVVSAAIEFLFSMRRETGVLGGEIAALKIISLARLRDEPEQPDLRHPCLFPV